MPGEISRPYRPPDTPEWREAQKAVDDWIDALQAKKEQERKAKDDQPEEEIPW